jgi:integrase/recombinase XerD
MASELNGIDVVTLGVLVEEYFRDRARPGRTDRILRNDRRYLVDLTTVAASPRMPADVRADRAARDLIKLADFEALVEAVPAGAPNALRDRALLEVLFATGCRVSELCGLTRRQVNLKTREVEIRGIGKKVRGTFLTAAAAERLARYLATRKDDSPYLFVSRQSVRRVRDPRTGVREARKGVYPLAPRTVRALVERLGLRAGLPARQLAAPVPAWPA